MVDKFLHSISGLVGFCYHSVGLMYAGRFLRAFSGGPFRHRQREHPAEERGLACGCIMEQLQQPS